MTHEELTHLMSLVHSVDVDHRGQITFQELLRTVRAVDLRSPRGQHTRGFRAGAALVTVMPNNKNNIKVDDFAPWVMEAYKGAGRGGEYLLDPESGA